MAEIAEHLQDKYNVRCDTFLEVFGPDYGTCHLMMDFQDLVAFEEFGSQLGSDEEFGAIHKKEADISIEGSVTQALLHSSA